MNENLISTYAQLVKHFGSQSNTARSLGVEQPSVNAWIKGKAKMSELVALTAEAVTGGVFKASELCPSLKALESVRQLQETAQTKTPAVS